MYIATDFSLPILQKMPRKDIIITIYCNISEYRNTWVQYKHKCCCLYPTFIYRAFELLVVLQFMSFDIRFSTY